MNREEGIAKVNSNLVGRIGRGFSRNGDCLWQGRGGSVTITSLRHVYILSKTL